MPNISPERLLSDLDELRSIGATGNGVVRPALSESDLYARRWLAQKYEAADLHATIDGVGNVLGRSVNPGPGLLIGSHSDTQPTGGWLDGALGVIYGLEIARALADDPETSGFAVDAVSWQDEESRFVGCLGSRSYCGLLASDELDGVRDKEGVALADLIADAGLAGEPRLQIDEGRYLGFLEAHIEQGPHLEAEDLKIGIVDTIVGMRGTVFTIEGQQNHAGTTMMAGRKDAATALYALAHAINQEFPKVAGPRSVWTLGRVLLQPNAPSIVPGYAELELQYRDVSSDVLDAFAGIVERLVAETNSQYAAQIGIAPSRVQIPPADMDAALRGHLVNAAKANTADLWREMPSGAFHDAGVVCGVMPAAMLFIPSIGGISHDFAEDSHRDDIVLGCRVLADAAAAILMDSAASQ